MKFNNIEDYITVQDGNVDSFSIKGVSNIVRSFKENILYYFAGNKLNSYKFCEELKNAIIKSNLIDTNVVRLSIREIERGLYSIYTNIPDKGYWQEFSNQLISIQKNAISSETVTDEMLNKLKEKFTSK